MNDHLKSDNIIERKICINKIPAILLRPKGSRGQLSTIILYHGWSSNKEFQRIRGMILSIVGYQVIIPDAIYHGERGNIDYNDAENMRKYFWDTILKNLDESDDIIDGLISQYDANPNSIGIIGHSMGGFTAAGIFTHNPKVKTSVVLNGSYNWGNSNRIFKKAFEIEEIKDLKDIENKINKLDPMNNMKLLNNRPMLILHGASDDMVAIESQRIFHNKIKSLYEDKTRVKLIEYPNLGHFVTTNMMEECIHWFHRYL